MTRPPPAVRRSACVAALLAIGVGVGFVPGARAAAPGPCTLAIASDADLGANGVVRDAGPGSTICIAAGTYGVPLVLAGLQGTRERPIRVIPWPPEARPRFGAGVLLRHVAFVEVSGLDVSQDPRRSPWAAVTLDAGTHHATIRDFQVRRSYLGITIGSSEGAAGPGNVVSDSLVEDNWNTGIAIAALSDGAPGEPNVVRGNRVLRNGGHGIEISDANGVDVERNVVDGNSTGADSVQQGGYSGIHVFASAATTAASPHGVRAAHNRIAFNMVTGTLQPPTTRPCRDGSGSGVCADGNGIQVDAWTSANEIDSNVVSGNAGDGISVYGSKDNLVHDNRVRGNNLQEGRLRLSPGPAEIAIVSAVDLRDATASGNVVRDNTAAATVDQVPAFFQSPNAARNVVGAGNRWRPTPAQR